MNNYEFLQTKIDIAPESGHVEDPENVNSVLLPHQRDAVIWALKGGRKGIGVELNEGYFARWRGLPSGGRHGQRSLDAV